MIHNVPGVAAWVSCGECERAKAQRRIRQRISSKSSLRASIASTRRQMREASGELCCVVEGDTAVVSNAASRRGRVGPEAQYDAIAAPSAESMERRADAQLETRGNPFFFNVVAQIPRPAGCVVGLVALEQPRSNWPHAARAGYGLCSSGKVGDVFCKRRWVASPRQIGRSRKNEAPSKNRSSCRADVVR